MNKRHIFRDKDATVFFSPAGSTQAYIVASSAGPENAASCAYKRIGALLAEHGLEVVHERAFGTLSGRDAILQARAKFLTGCENWPVTYIEGLPVAGTTLAGVQIQAVFRDRVQSIRTIADAGSPCGRAWSSNGKNFAILQNMRAAQPAADRSAQAAEMIRRAGEILRSQGISYRHVARTWIYLDDILDWYQPFNQARNEQYGQLGLVTSGPGALLPASTGIEGANPHGGACLMDVLAVSDSRGDQPVAAQLSNLRQQDAFAYGSAFSRGAHIRDVDSECFHISGTAAIDQAGKSMFAGDVRSQVAATLDHVEALLGQRGMGLSDICSSTAFVKLAGDYDAVRDAMGQRGLADLPAVYMVADVCRAELLFELDGIAAK